jgi:2-oxoglutarate dehydrogenase E1 component
VSAPADIWAVIPVKELDGAKQRLAGDTERRTAVVPVVLHGDAAFPGQGVVAECLNMMRLEGYTVGGTIHVIINNQVGFTTDQKDLFSGRYCTDMAKMVEAPIFHVNGDDPEACAWAARLALDWRQNFGTDVVIDMWCYRKNGHNETDEPNFTQPLLYQRVRKQVTVMRRYADVLQSEGVISNQFNMSIVLRVWMPLR